MFYPFLARDGIDMTAQDREAQYNAKRNAQPTPVMPPVPDISALLRIMQGQNVAQAPSQQPPQPVAAPAPAAGLESIFAQFARSNPQPGLPIQQPTQQPAPGFNLQAALANMDSAQPQPAYGAPAPVPNLEAIIAQIGNSTAAAQAPMQNFGYGNQYDNENDRKRPHEPEDDYGRKKYKGSDKPLPYKVKVCKYWQEGRCRRGDECSYLHEQP